MPLNDVTCRNAKPRPRPYKLFDGGGLHLHVAPSGGRLWRLKYRYGGKEKLLSFGPYPLIPLSEARRRRDDAKVLLLNGLDPAVALKQSKEAEDKGPTFGEVASEWLDKIRREGRAPSTLAKYEWLLRDLAMPDLGSVALRDLTTAQVLKPLKAVEAKGHYETAKRLRTAIGVVCRYAIALDLMTTDPVAATKGAITTPRVTHFAAITDADEFGGLLRALDSFTGEPATKAALQLMAYLACRPGELRTMQWSDLDLTAGVWTIPAERSKMRRVHRVPLARQAVAVLNGMKPLTAHRSPYVFPNLRSAERPMSEVAMNAALRRMGFAKTEMTSHGFRSSFSTLVYEARQWTGDAIEAQLGHQEGNAVKRAYKRSDHWDERLKMMAWWADYIDGLKAGRK